ncbi:DUF4350 domain-containing protein [Thermococcus sp. Bubb.Bath]|uniref:DUF4350 domain-containing protein n=1 Tax=Thermococcus sp. Bubb.Bath TaxID=1638242 RepID=UPI00143A862C|nr:DUF4350 domain-containing protein [Thermococcus sp. Bubb.Bath]NJF25141.1 DUF4350 domain-containing protein [Thermococcus sp. Bubb.Bath]
MRRTVKYALLVTGIFILFTMPLTVPHFESSAPYSMFNDSWDGLSRFTKLLYDEGKTPVPLLGPIDSYDLSGGTLLIVGPNVDYSPDEIKAIKEFVRRGNTLVIADDFGTGNEILRGLGLPMRLSNYPLRDFFYRIDDRFVIAIKITDPVLGRNVTEVVTSDPSAIIVTRKGEVYTSGTAMINFHRRAYPLLAITKYGDGRVIVLADPDILRNNLFKQNYNFLRNLAEYIPGPVYVDEAHHRNFNLYSQGTITIRRVLPRERAEEILLITGIIAVLYEFGLFGYMLRPFRWTLMRLFGGEKSLEDLAVELARERGWDEREVLEMLKGMGDGE